MKGNISPNNVMNTGIKKRRSFVALLFAAGYGERWVRRFASIPSGRGWPRIAVPREARPINAVRARHPNAHASVPVGELLTRAPFILIMKACKSGKAFLLVSSIFLNFFIFLLPYNTLYSPLVLFLILGKVWILKPVL